MKIKKLLLCLGILFSVGSAYASENHISVPIDQNGERHIVVVVASYNNLQYHRTNLGSIFDQKYSNYHVIYIDDCSNDGMYEKIKKFIYLHKKEDTVTLIRNNERRGALHNQYDAIHMCKDTDLIVILDGDDWFFNNDVFSYLNMVYAHPDVWLTSGQFIQHPTRHRGWCAAMPHEIVANNTFRDYIHAPGHLRTFYAGLFKQIKEEDLLYNGDFFRMTGDIAAMFPMIEMARHGHFKFLNQILMVYNIGNPINDHKVIQGLQKKLDIEIRRRRKYDPIETPFLPQKREKE